jgi:hypothetical protein
MNPYLPWIDRIVEHMLGHDPETLARSLWRDRYTHWNADNEWRYRLMAGFLYTTAFAHTSGTSRWHNATVTRDYCLPLFDRLVDAARDDRWYHLAPGQGDSNLDRYTLLLLMDAFLLMRHELSPALTGKVLSKIDGALRVQIEEFSRPKKDDQPYPNMDAIFCQIMVLGHGLTKYDGCQREAERFLKILESAQFPGGAWTYIQGTNECPIYHGGDLVALGRIWEANRDERVQRMIQRSVPYYPQIASHELVAEYYTDPWWKHQWVDLDPWGPDIVASLTGDGRNRWMANRLRDAFGAKLMAMNDAEPHFCLPWFVDAARLWQDVPETPPESIFLTYDANIEGPRARWADWSWAATARYGSDTIVGAMLNRQQDGHVVALMGITPEIEHQHEGQPDAGMTRLALGVTPCGTRGTTQIEGDRATFDVTYQMASFRSVWGQAPYPSAWECRQHWQMDAHALRGQIEVVSLKDQDAPSPLVRIRWGRHLRLEELPAGGYVYGPFCLHIRRSDFPTRLIQPATACVYETVQDATQLILRPPPATHYAQGQTFALELEISL